MSAVKATVKSARNRLLGAVHQKAKARGLDDASYRDLLERITGQRSAAACSDQDLRRVLDELGGQHRRPPRQAQATRLADGPQARKIRALWLVLYQAGEVRRTDEAAIAAFAARTTGNHDGLGHMSPRELSQVIEALKDWCRRSEHIVEQDGAFHAIRGSG